MRKYVLALMAFAALAACATGLWAADAVYPAAIFPFEERGASVKDFGIQVSDILFARLVADPQLMLVDRAEIAKTLGEQSLNVSGVVKAEEATQVGQLTGAKLLITGSVLKVDKKLYLIAKIMGTETTRVAGTSVDGPASDELGPLVEKLAAQISETIGKQSENLVAKKETPRDRAETLKKQLGDGKRPIVRIQIAERHVGQATIDPAAQTEIALLCRTLGFEVVDNEAAAEGAADVLISGEGFSETIGRIGGLVSVKARVEIKVVDRKTGKVIAADRQTARVVDATEQIAGKTALQEAAGELAERILPQIAKAGKK